MQAHTNLLFLADAEFDNFEDTKTIPLINGWRWMISGAGRGCLLAPDDAKHCQFDLVSGQLQFEPDGTPFTAPGLSAALVQEMGETYACDMVFSEEDKKAYDTHAKARETAKKTLERNVRDALSRAFQMERKGDSYLVYVDTDKVKHITGVEVPHVLSKKEGVSLFNRLSEKLHCRPLADPTGYMALDGNIYEFIHTEYANQYEDMLQAVDNQFVDGTGYGLTYVLDNLQSVVRKNITHNCLPKNENYGNLRFVAATDERKRAVTDFVKQRVSMTLTNERKRDYECAAIDKTKQKFHAAADRLKETLFSEPAPPAMSL